VSFNNFGQEIFVGHLDCATDTYRLGLVYNTVDSSYFSVWG